MIHGVVTACFGPDVEAEVFTSTDKKFIKCLDCYTNWSAEINDIGNSLRAERYVDGIALADPLRRWVVYQNRPVDIGIFSIDCDKDFIYSQAVKDFFFDSSDISNWLKRRKLNKIHWVEKMERLDVQFLEILLRNYSDGLHSEGRCTSDFRPSI